MYDLLYDFFYTKLLNTAALNDFTLSVLNNTINLREYLSHTLSIIGIILVVVAFFLFARWLIRTFMGFFKW